MTQVVINEGSTSTIITVTDLVHKSADEKLLSESDILTTDEVNLTDIVGKDISNDNVTSAIETPNHQEKTNIS